MRQIIINSKICDRAPECGGISVCPTHALSFDSKNKQIIWDESKCTFCLKCTLPDSCPVGAIMFARDDEQKNLILDTINSDPHTDDWLWQERYGVMPATAQSSAINLDNSNFNEVMADKKNKIIDIWHTDFLNCRLHSPLFSELLAGITSPPQIFKLDAQKYPQIAKKLKTTIFPSLLVYKNNLKVFEQTGYIESERISSLNNQFKKFFK